MSKRLQFNGNYLAVHSGKLTRVAGGKWNPKKKVWKLPPKEVLELGLKN